MSLGVTRTLNRQNEGTFRGYRQQRAHDYLYDPVCTFGSETDHIRARFQALASVERVKKVPEFKTMFSDLPHRPRYALRLDAADPVPSFIDRRWRSPARHSGQAGYGRASDCDVSGADRWKYFKRPLAPFAQHVPPDVVFAEPKSPRFGPDGAQEHVLFAAHRTVHTQTDYRDSEAQTDPYTPKHALRPGSSPELLTLVTLTWNRGLPAGLAEVEMIERMRLKKAWEATLPPLNDLSQLQKRRKMMDEMERKEWAFREGEIQKLQERRLALLTQLLNQREERQQQRLVKHLDSRFAQCQRDKEAKIKRIRHDYILSIRRLMEKRRNVEGKLRRRGAVEEYCSRGPRGYTPTSRMGRFPDGDSDPDSIKNWLQNTYEGLLVLESTLPASVMEPRIHAPKPRSRKGFVKRADRREMELIRTHEELKLRKTKVEEKKPLRFLTEIEKPPPRPPTPAVTPPPAGLEERDLAAICLQKLLRGASSKEAVYEGKERRLELIQELRSTHALQQGEQELQEAEKQATLALQRERELQSHKVMAMEALQSGVAGGVIADMLDFLSKELERLQEERRIHAFTLLAERHRRMREAEESGRRQVEERRRREEDEIFRQVVLVHQATVDLYLEDVILSSIEKTADEQAREEIHKMAEEINDIAYAMEESLTNVRSEEIVAELVYSFLIPEVQKTTVRNRVKATQQQHVRAARDIVHGSVEEATAATPPPPTELATSPSPLEPAMTPPPMETATTPTPMEPATTPSPMEPTMTPPPMETATTPSPMEPAMTPPPMETATTPSPMEPAMTPPPMEPAATPSPMEPATTPSPMESAMTPTPMEPAMTPLPMEPATTPPPMEPATTPTPMEPATPPSPMEPATTPTPMEPATPPSPMEPATPPSPMEPATPPSPMEPATIPSPVEPATTPSPMDSFMVPPAGSPENHTSPEGLPTSPDHGPPSQGQGEGEGEGEGGAPGGAGEEEWREGGEWEGKGVGGGKQKEETEGIERGEGGQVGRKSGEGGGKEVYKEREEGEGRQEEEREEIEDRKGGEEEESEEQGE